VPFGLLRGPSRLLLGLLMSVGGLVVARPSLLPTFGSGGDAAPSPSRCYFQFEMRLLRSEIPDQVGDCLENQHYNPENGDTLQRTTGGLMVWRRSSRTVAFTDGARTWAHGPNGLESRSNDQRFDWEASPGAVPADASAQPAPTAAASSRPPLPPTATPRPIVVATAEASGSLAGIAAAAVPNTQELVSGATEMVLIASLKASGLPVQNVQALTAASDPSRQLGRPGQYSSKIVWRDARASGDDSAIELFPDEASLRARLQALTTLPKGAPDYTPYVFADAARKTLIRLPKALAPDQAQSYQRWLSTIH
jgi:hypothetical protein